MIRPEQELQALKTKLAGESDLHTDSQEEMAQLERELEETLQETSVFDQRVQDNFGSFVETIARLRAPDGCPWDRKQTHESLAKHLIEESWETVDAIESKDAQELKSELGDVLLQVVLHAQIAKEVGDFDIADVCEAINSKMIRRHPHVFGKAHAQTPEEVEALWEQVKLAEQAAGSKEKSQESPDQGAVQEVPRLLKSVPKHLPALMEAQKISVKAAAAGFEWEALEDVWDQVRSEEAEVRAAYKALQELRKEKEARGAEVTPAPSTQAGFKSKQELKHELELEVGDLLFSVVNLARWMGVDAESALKKSSAKFKRRWEHMETAAYQEKCELSELETAELEALWKKAKQEDLG